MCIISTDSASHNILKTQFIMSNGKQLVWIVLLISILAPFYIQAKHIIGGTIYYECLGVSTTGTHKYRFTMKVYRDCLGGGAAFDDPAEFAIYRGSSINNIRQDQFKSALLIFKQLEPDTPLCVRKLPNVCVEEATYSFERELKISSTESYFVVYQRCCRNETIKNLKNPGNIGATFMVELTPEAQITCNNSPVFKNFPPIVICNHVPLEFDHSAKDVDGDLLVYSFCSPLVGGGNILQAPAVYDCDGAVPTPPCGPPFDNAAFITPTYTPSAPMGGNPVISINGATGRITGTPNLLGQFVVSVCVSEFRNGKLLSVTQREFQFNVADCAPSVLAVIDTATLAKGVYEINSCGSLDVNLFNLSFERDNISKFRWIFDSNGFYFQDSLNWDKITVSFPDTGHYEGRLLLNEGKECSDTAFLKVNVYPGIYADFSYAYDTCVAGPVQFIDASKGEGIIDKWSWNFGSSGEASTVQSPTHLYQTPGIKNVTLRITDKNYCRDQITKPITWYPVAPYIILQPDAFVGCIPQTVTFNNLSLPIDSTYHIEWTFGDGADTSNVISPSHLYTTEGIYDVGVSITSPIGCHVDTVFNNLIRMRASPIADFTFSPDTLLSNINNTVQFTDQSTAASAWNWTFGKFGVSTLVNPVKTFTDTGLVKVRLIVTHRSGCQDSLTKTLDFRPEIRWFMPNAFTPNNDGINEGFKGKGFLTGYSNFSMTIWNRWGELVFETNNPEEAWNGRLRNTGDMSPAGVYVYVVRFTGPRGEINEYKGYATLIK